MIEHSSASLKDALYSIVAEYAGVSCVVIHANENNAVEPTGVYCMIRTMSSKVVAHESRNAISAVGNLQKTVMTKQTSFAFLSVALVQRRRKGRLRNLFTQPDFSNHLVLF